jgi:hypothetical protein
MIGPLSYTDLLLLTVVTAQATIHAYIPDAKMKAFFYMLPFPFTAAALTINDVVDSTNIWSLLLLLAHAHNVRILHTKLKLAIVPSIIASLLICVGLGFVMAPTLMFVQNQYSLQQVFWLSCAGILAISLIIQRLMPIREEPSHRTQAPLPLKIVSVAAVVLVLILLKKHLGGFITAFPMVGAVAAFEARGSLWTMSRQVSVLLPALAALMVTVHWAQTSLEWPLWQALGAGWVAYLPLMLLCTPAFRKRILNRREQAEVEAMPAAD